MDGDVDFLREALRVLVDGLDVRGFSPRRAFYRRATHLGYPATGRAATSSTLLIGHACQVSRIWLKLTVVRWLDGLTQKVREGGRIVNVCVVVAILLYGRQLAFRRT